MRLLLIDGPYYSYRSFYAIRNLSNSRKEPTNAVYGYVKTLQKMLQDIKPDFAAVIFDAGKPAARLAIQENYKANRAETPADLVTQFSAIDRVIDALGFKRLSIEGEEADDLIASYAREALKNNYEVVIGTNDKDIMQLVGEKCWIYQTDKDGFQLLGAKEVEEKWGVPPTQIGEILALTGDAVDNIPGVPGIGPKTAAVLIRKFKNVENLLQNLKDVESEKTRAAIETHIEQIKSNQKMITLRHELALPEPIEKLLIVPNYEEQVKVYADLEFKSLLKETQSKLDKPTHFQGELF
jgi:DNA polymerase I